MPLPYFEIIIKHSKENLDSIDRLLIDSSTDDIKTLELVKQATKIELLHNKEILLKPIPVEKHMLLIELLKKYIVFIKVNPLDLKLGKTYRDEEYEILSQISKETNIAGYILKNCIISIDSQYNADKYIASRYVDKFSQECFIFWSDNLPKKNDLNDILDLIVIAVMQCRGNKLNGTIRRFIGKFILKLMGKYG